ncbi:MAG: quinone oxidoreductase family protein [Cytophaga sp.]|uniref:quinone oxidoreductase family protein n=1 Tax=Cytophaga sp. TaxID=29535 RepID=UPI003F7E0687
MKANVIIQNGNAADVFRVIEQEIPTPQSDEALVHVQYTSVNPLDCRIRSIPNSRRSFPVTLGYDVYGTIVDTGDAVNDLHTGDTIIASPDPFFAGANAEYVVVKAIRCLKVEQLDPKIGAAIPLVGITAYEALHDKLKIQSNDTILIHAGAGGVGHIAVQLAKHMHCKVITTASRPESIEFCKHILKADHVINYQTENLKDRIDTITNGEGLAYILDTVGGDTFTQSIDCLRSGGHICTILPVSFDAATGYANLLKNISISYEFMNVSGATGRHRTILKKLVEMIDNKQLVPHISAIYGFEDIDKAHIQMEGKHTMGKILIRVQV